MTQEEKRLLLIDLCARLPYGVKVKNTHSDTVYDLKEYMYCLPTALATNFKPYLRQMSSMTEEERNEYFDFRNQELQRVAFAEIGRESAIAEISDWLNAHHFDYRGLIEKGLAMEAPEGMYN